MTGHTPLDNRLNEDGHNASNRINGLPLGWNTTGLTGTIQSISQGNHDDPQQIGHDPSYGGHIMTNFTVQHIHSLICNTYAVTMQHISSGFATLTQWQCSYAVAMPHIRSWLCNTYTVWGAQWLSGRVLDSRPKGSGFEPHRRHCVVVLEQDTFILA